VLRMAQMLKDEDDERLDMLVLTEMTAYEIGRPRIFCAKPNATSLLWPLATFPRIISSTSIPTLFTSVFA
jgi:hypothetical protein